MMKVSRGSKGFTLIELLIVVAIIGILAAIAIPAYTGYTKKAKVAGIVHTMGAIKNAIVAYYSEAGAAPAVALASAADGGTIRTTLGVSPSEQYATYAVAATSGMITATPAASVNIGGNLTLTPGADFKNWTWGGSCEDTYKPKN